VLVEAGMEKSRSSARKMIEGGGIYVNDEPARPDRVLEKADLLAERYVMLRRGKKQRLLLVLSDAAPN
jgi:tyrosyl-tRNA synthetase